MIWVRKPMNTNSTAGWVGWSQEIRDQLCSRGFGSEKKGPLWNTNSETFRSNRGFHYLRQIWPIRWERHFNVVLCLNTVDHLMQMLDWMRPPAPVRGPAHTSLRRWVVPVVVYWSSAKSFHPNLLNIASILFHTRCEIFFKLWRQW